MTKNEVAKKAETSIMSPDIMEMMEESSGLGTETLNSGDKLRVELKIAQQTSPQLKSKSPKYIAGLKQGDLFNSASGKVYGTSANIAVLGVYKALVVWGTLDDISSEPPEEEVFEATDPKRYAQILNECTVDDKNRRIWKGTKKVNSTYRVAAVVFNEDGTYEPVVIDCIKTKYKNGKQLNALLDSIRFTDREGRLRKAPACATLIRVDVAEASNDMNDWYELKFSRALAHDLVDGNTGLFKADVLSALLAEAKLLRDNLLSGKDTLSVDSTEDEEVSANVFEGDTGNIKEEVF